MADSERPVAARDRAIAIHQQHQRHGARLHPCALPSGEVGTQGAQQGGVGFDRDGYPLIDDIDFICCHKIKKVPAVRQ